MTTSTPTPWTNPQPLQEALALGPGLDRETLRKGLEVLAGREDVQALVVFGSRACEGARPDSDLDLLVIGREARIEPEDQIQRWQELRTALGMWACRWICSCMASRRQPGSADPAGLCSAMRHAAGGFCRSPSEDAALLLVTVRRDLRSLAMTTDPAFPQEDWDFLAQQALEKVLKVSIVLMDRKPLPSVVAGA